LTTKNKEGAETEALQRRKAKMEMRKEEEVI